MAAGTHYADLTGEALFIRASIDRCHEAAARKSVRIAHSCGFDSIPSDLGVLLLHGAAGELEETTAVVRSFKGGVSGGTIASLKLTLDETHRGASRAGWPPTRTRSAPSAARSPTSETSAT